MSMKMRAVGYFNAGTIKIFGQLRLPLVALVSTYLLSRRYSREQWQAIVLVALSCFLFMWFKEKQGRSVKGNDQLDVQGLLLLAGWILLNVLGGVFAERAYKSGDKPFFSKKVSEDFGYLVLNLLMLFVVPCCDPDENVFDRLRRPGCLFDSWDRRTVAMVVMLMLDATASNWLLQEFSALTKSVMKAFCVAIIYFMSLTYREARDQRKTGTCSLNCSALLVVGRLGSAGQSSGEKCLEIASLQCLGALFTMRKWHPRTELRRSDAFINLLLSFELEARSAEYPQLASSQAARNMATVVKAAAQAKLQAAKAVPKAPGPAKAAAKATAPAKAAPAPKPQASPKQRPATPSAAGLVVPAKKSAPSAPEVVQPKAEAVPKSAPEGGEE
ncbi:unnamed protein product, partial [Symbiodinium pilosum]